MIRFLLTSICFIIYTEIRALDSSETYTTGKPVYPSYAHQIHSTHTKTGIKYITKDSTDWITDFRRYRYGYIGGLTGMNGMASDASSLNIGFHAALIGGYQYTPHIRIEARAYIGQTGSNKSTIYQYPFAKIQAIGWYALFRNRFRYTKRPFTNFLIGLGISEQFNYTQKTNWLGIPIAAAFHYKINLKIDIGIEAMYTKSVSGTDYSYSGGIGEINLRIHYILARRMEGCPIFR